MKKSHDFIRGCRVCKKASPKAKLLKEIEMYILIACNFSGAKEKDSLPNAKVAAEIIYDLVYEKNTRRLHLR